MGEHIVKFDDPRFIPLARSRIAAIRRSGLKFGSQKFMVDGVTITVHVKGAQEYIRVEGGDDGWYSIFPASEEHPGGVVELTNADDSISYVTPYAVALPNGTTRAHIHYMTGRFDWVSFDGYAKDGTAKYGKHLITFDGSTPGRYPQAFISNASWYVLSGIVIDGKPATFSRTVSGIGMKQVSVAIGSDPTLRRIHYIVYASVTSISNVSTVVDFYSAPMEDISTPPDAHIRIGTVTIPGPIRQPFYFDGMCAKCVSYAAKDDWSAPIIVDVEVNATSGGLLSVSASFTVVPVRAPTPLVTSPDPNINRPNGTVFVTAGTPHIDEFRVLGVDLSVEGRRSIMTSTYEQRVYASEVNIPNSGGSSIQYQTFYYIDDVELFATGTDFKSHTEGAGGGGFIDTRTELRNVSKIFDMDLRYSAVVWATYTQGSHKHESAGYPNNNFVYSTTAGSLILSATFDGDSGSEVLGSVGASNTANLSVAVNTVGYMITNVGDVLKGAYAKMFASRQHGSYMLCAGIHPSIVPSIRALIPNISGDPIIMRRKSPGKNIKLDVLGLSGDTGVTHMPITLVYSTGSVKF